jgi:hypothetical protein
MSIPILFYFGWELIIEKKKINKFFSKIIFTKEKTYQNNKIYWFQLLILIYVLLEFLSIKFPIHEIDIYHEGQRLSSAYKSKLNGSLWSGSYVTVGIIYEILGAKYIWKIFNNDSIGLVRFLDIFYIFITKIILIFISLQITKTLNFNSFYKTIFFLISSLVFLNCINYNSADVISFREIPILLTLLFFLISLRDLNKLHLSYIILGFLTVATFFWSIDRAIVQNLLILFIIIYLTINKNYKNIGVIVISSFFFWLFFYFFLNKEFNYFVDNTISIFKEMNSIHGIIHPIPFIGEENSSRATKNLLSILISLLISLNVFFNNKNYLTYRYKVVLLVISFISFLSYIYALGRSDGVHFKQVFGFSVIFFSIYLSFYLIHFISKKYHINDFKNKKIFSLIIFLLIFIFFNPNIYYSKIINYKARFINYISLKDENFLSKRDANFIKEASKFIKNEKCIQLYTNDAALLYLLKKPNCTKFYFVWSIGSKKNQLKMIEELKSTKYIIKNGITDNWGIPLKIKYPLLNEYINNNFTLKKKIDERVILYKK